MANHYKTLRVKRTATQQEIKGSYRGLAAELHPDKKDGNAEKFKEIVNAYEILSNPSRRKFYDLTGSDVTEAEFNRKAGGLLQSIFESIISRNGLEQIEGIDMIKTINENIDTGMIELEKKIDITRKSRVVIGRILKRVKHKNKTNPISIMLKHEIQKHTDAITKSKQEMEVGTRARAMLKEYSFDYDQQTQRMNIEDETAYRTHTFSFTGI